MANVLYDSAINTYSDPDVEYEGVESAVTISSFDAVAITESFAAVPFGDPAQLVFDNIAVVESTTVAVGLALEVNEAVTVAESVTTSVDPLILSLVDSIAIAENLDLMLGTLVPNVSDSIAIAENITNYLDVLVPDVFSQILITEHASPNDEVVEVGVVESSAHVDEYSELSLDVLYVSVFDTASVSDSASQYLGTLVPDVSDSITVEESFEIIQNLGLETSESITVSEFTVFDRILEIYDSIVITETFMSLIVGAIELNDTISVSEYVNMYRYAPPIRATCLNVKKRGVITVYPREGVCV